ncbi:MAG: hypothetical protein A4E32_00808 [Methanomassiliicoccales archaeon PtaU1.Bin124]|nr:MAG: hypothetical protein A4E32_00808 [Methanomassiliicoccales archaeon PtaU1.Bin124]
MSELERNVPASGSCSKYEEADLYLRLFSMYSSEELSSAFRWFHSRFNAKDLDDFEKECPPGSVERSNFWKIGNFFDLIGTLLKREYLDKELLIDLCPDDVRSYWTKASPLVKEMRPKYNDPRLYADLELLYEEIQKEMA